MCIFCQGKTRVSESIDDETFGMLFFADVFSFEEIHSEIEKILITDNLVENWTYPLIQPKLIEEAKTEDIYKFQVVELKNQKSLNNQGYNEC